jgi:methylglutaconyl-CoA hydratase
MMSQETVLLNIDDRGVATITLNRPDLHNAFNDEVIARLTRLFAEVTANKKIRAMVLASTGASFSAGAELGWMKRAATFTYEENLADARKIAQMMDDLARIPKPTIALVQGAAYGGGVGLVSACDIVIAIATATFSLSEVKLGLIPATISPHVVAAIGARQAKRYFTTAERFDGVTAQRIGLVHEIVGAPEDLGATRDRILSQILQAGPEAVAAAKDLVFAVAGQPINPELMDDTARRIADRRMSAEGQEGLSAFLEKRKPNWI